MTKFCSEFTGCFKETEYNEFLFGRSERYLPFQLNYKIDIQPYCIESALNAWLSKGQNDLGYAANVILCAEYLFPLIDASLTYANHSKTKTKQLEEKFETREIRSEIRNPKEYNYMCEKLRLSNHTFHINDVMPVDINDTIIRAIKHLYNILEIKAKPTVIANKNQPKSQRKTLESHGIVFRKRGILFQNVSFDRVRDISQIQNMLKDESPYQNLEVYFYNCAFSSNITHIDGNNWGYLVFKECLFPADCIISGSTKGNYVFDNCIFTKRFCVDMNDIYRLYVTNCTVDTDGTMEIKYFPKGDSRLIIADCRFYGNFELNNPQELQIELNRDVFFKPLVIKRGRFEYRSKFSDLCFPTNSSPQMEKSKQQLYDALVNSNLKEMAEDLNLLANAKPKKPAFDYAAYQAEYDTGWLQSKNAAYLLGRKDTYLSKKRMADKKKITRTTIPYRGDGKNIQYPVDALLAFKAQDWNKLKELRKKYSQTT